MSILLFFIVLFVLILVHEWGHFIVAKKTGMRVDEFGIGFPPKLFGIKRGETEYTFNLLPIGGFVKILGENGIEEGVLSDTDRARAFSARPRFAQALVLVAGVAMNILFAWFLFVVVLLIGVPTAVEEATASTDAELVVTEVLVDSPAAEAGLPIGAVITAVARDDEEVAILSPAAVTEFIQASESEPILITYQDGGGDKTLTLTPEINIVSDQTAPAIGVRLSLIETIALPLHQAIYQATVRTVGTLGAIIVGLTTLIADSIQGQADFSTVAGPVGIVGMVGDAAEFGVVALLVFTAIISLNLAVINLLPFPALDGGRLVFVAIESIIRRPISPVWTTRVNFIGFALLILLMVAVTYSDITKIL